MHLKYRMMIHIILLFFFFFLLRNDYFTNLDCISCFLKQKEKEEEEEDCITS